MVNSHQTQAYVLMLINHYRLWWWGGFALYSKSSLVMAKNWVIMKFQDYVLRAWSMSLITFGPLFHIEDALIWNWVQQEKVDVYKTKVLCARITLSCGNFVQKIWTNFGKHFQKVRRFEEKMCYEHIFEVIMLRNFIYLELVRLRRINQSNILPSPTRKQ